MFSLVEEIYFLTALYFPFGFLHVYLVCDFLGAHNSSQLLLKWDRLGAVDVANQLHLTEFRLVNHWTLESIMQVKQAYNTIGKLLIYLPFFFASYILQ